MAVTPPHYLLLWLGTTVSSFGTAPSHDRGLWTDSCSLALFQAVLTNIPNCTITTNNLSIPFNGLFNEFAPWIFDTNTLRRLRIQSCLS